MPLSFTGTSSNVRGPAQQSLQEAAAGVSRTGQQVGNSMGNLASILAQLNTQIMKTFQQQQEESRANEERIAAGIEQMSNKIASAYERKTERRQDLSDRKELMDYGAGIDRRTQMDQEARQKSDAARQAREDAIVQEELQKVAANYQKAESARQKYLGTLSAMQTVVGDASADPKVRTALQKMLLDLSRNPNSHLMEQPEAIQSLGRIWEAKARQHFAEGQLVGPPSSGMPAPPSEMMVDESVTFSPGAVDSLLKGQMSSAPEGPFFGNAEAPTTIGNLSTLVHALRLEQMNRKFATDEQRLQATKKLAELAAQSQITSREHTKRYEQFKGVIEHSADEKIAAGIAAAALKPENYEPVKDGPGKSLSPRAMYDSIVQQFATDPKMMDWKRRMDAGEPVLTNPQSVNFGIWTEVVNDQIALRFPEVAKQLQSKAGGNIKAGLGQKDFWSLESVFSDTGKRDEAVNSALAKVPSLATASKQMLAQQPAIRGIQNAMDTAYFVLTTTGKQGSLFDVKIERSGKEVGEGEGSAVSERASSGLVDVAAYHRYLREGGAEDLIKSYTDVLTKGILPGSTQKLIDTWDQLNPVKPATTTAPPPQQAAQPGGAPPQQSFLKSMTDFVSPPDVPKFEDELTAEPSSGGGLFESALAPSGGS